MFTSEYLAIGVFVFVLLAAIFIYFKETEKVEIFSKDPLSEIEKITYKKLVEHFKGERIVLAQVAFSSFIRTKGSKKAKFRKWLELKQKVADFVICDQDFKIEYIIEIDDKTHNKEKDRLRDKALEEAGLRTLRIQAKDIRNIDFRSAINEWEKISRGSEGKTEPRI